MHPIKFLFVFCLFHESLSAKSKRNVLIYPVPKSKIQLILGAGFPVESARPDVTIGYVIKCDYRLPKNISEYNDSEIIKVRKRSSRPGIRWEIYRMLESILFKYGGKSCLLKAICEFSRNTVDKTEGLISEILHAIFMPSVTEERIEDPLAEEYLAAEYVGKTETVDCSILFPECALNLIDLFTKWM